MNPEAIDYIPEGFFHMTQLAKELIRQGKKVMKYEFNGYWMDIGEKENYEKAQKDVENGNFNY